MSNNDTEKLLKFAKEYGVHIDMFTSQMLWGYINSKNVKFKKDMNSKKIGHILSRHPDFKVIKSTYRNYYKLC